MEQIYNTLKTIKEVAMREIAGKCRLSILSRMCLVSLILMTSGVENAWGKTATRTWTVKTKVSAGVDKGTATANIMLYYVLKDDEVAKTASTSKNSLVTATQTWSKTYTIIAPSPSDYYYPQYIASVTATGYHFGGWYDTSDKQVSTDATYYPKSGLNHGASTSNWSYEFYAKFLPNSYDVTLKANGGTGSDQVITATYDSDMPDKLKDGKTSISKPTRTGYTFAGYYDATSEGTQYYNSNLSSAHKWDKALADQVLYAHWTANSYIITLNNHSATTAGTASISVTYDKSTNLTATPAITVPTKTDYTFDGYYTAENGGGLQIIAANGNVNASVSGYTDGDKKWIHADGVTLHAKWVSNSKTITLDNQSATTAGTASIQVLYKKNKNLTGTPAITVPARTGYTFEGYYTAKNGSGLQVIAKNGNVNASVSGYTDASKNWQYDDNVTLYAYWKQNQSITWNQDFGTPVRSKEFTLNATAGSSMSVYYTATSNAGTVKIDGNKLTCLTAGEVTVTAHQDGNASWNAASASKTFTIIEHAITKNPTATGITYEQTLSNSKLSGGEANVAGTWDWKYPNSVPEVGSVQIAVFTPSSSVISAEPLECNVSVTIAKATPDITCTIGDNYMVDADALDLQSLWTREGNGQITYTVDSFTASGNNNGGATKPAVTSNRYLSLGQAGTLCIKMDIKEGSNYQARTVTKTLTIHKYNSIFANVEDKGVKVDGSVSSSYTLTYTKPDSKYIGTNTITAGTPGLNSTSGDFYYTLTQNVTTDNTTGSSNPTLAISYNASTKTATGKNAGTGTIHLYQKETYKYNAADRPFVVTVTKYDNNAITCSWGDEPWAKTLNFDEYTSVTFSSKHTITPINVNISKGDSIASYDKKNNKITASCNIGVAIWNVTQDENYKYYAAPAKTCKVTVDKKNCPTCYLYEGYTPKTVLGIEVEQDNITISDVDTIKIEEYGVANMLTYNLRINTPFLISQGAGDNGYLGTYVPGETWKKEVITATSKLSYDNLSKKLDANTTMIVFEQKNIDDPYIKNIRVSRLAWLKIEDLKGNALPSLTINNTIGGNTQQAKFRIRYSTCDDEVKVACSNSKLKIDVTSISTTDKKSGTREVTITYSSEQMECIDATISVYTRYEHAELKVHAATEKLGQIITWNSNLSGNPVVLPAGFTSSDAATATSGLPVTYSTTTPEIILISEDKSTFKVINVGENAKLIATQAGNDTYKAVSDTLTINATNKKIQTISWAQNFTRNLKPDSICDLKAEVYITNLLDGTQSLSAERTALIQYACAPNDTIIAIDNNTKKMRILNYGTTTITASVAGDDNDYEEAVSVKKTVKVRKLSAGECEGNDPIYTQSEEIDVYYLETYDLHSIVNTLKRPEVEKQIKIDLSKGVPDSLSVKVTAEPYIVPVTNKEHMAGYVTILTSSDNGSTWSDTLAWLRPKIYETDSCIIPLSSDVNLIKFYRPKGGEGHHKIEDATVTRKQFIEAEDTINLGKMVTGALVDTVIHVNYSDARKAFEVTRGKAISKNKLVFEEDKIYVSCGETDVQKFPFQFQPMVAGDWKDTITITDPQTKKSASVILMATVEKGYQSINWNPQTILTAIDEVELNGKATSELDITYTLLDGKANAKIENGQVVILQPGTFTIAASQEGNKDYYAADSIKRTFTVSAAPLTLPELTATSITYGQPLSDSKLSHTVEAVDAKNQAVAGTYKWQAPSTYPNAGTASYTVVFTPSVNPQWYSGLTTSATVEVAKATPTATSAEAITYGQAVKESSLSNIAAQGTWSWRDEDKETILSADEYEMDVHFTPANNNYQETDAKVLLVVNKATPELSWISAPTELGYDATDIEYLAISTSNESAITYSIISGSEFAFINSTTGVLNTIEPGNTITVQAEQDASQNYLRAITTIDVIIHAANVFTNSTGDGDWENENNWEAGVIPGEGEDVLINGDVVLSDTIMEVGNLTLGGGSITIGEGAQLTINGDSKQRDSYGDLIIKQGGEVVLGISASFKVRNFIIEAALSDNAHEAKSGQLSNGAELTVNGEAFFDLILDQSGKCTPGWYDFAVPFPVDASTGVSRFQNGAWNNELRIETHYAIMDFHEDLRAADQYAWKKYHGVLNPNQCYTMTINSSAPLYRFKKKEGASLIATNELQLQATGDSESRGWNGLGNGSLEVRNLEVADDVKVQLYNHSTNSYESKYAKDISFATGSSFFMQTATEGTVNLLEANTTRSLRAQERSPRTLSEFSLELTENGATTVADRLYVSVSEDALNSYEIGHDLSKMGTPTEAKVAQFWCDAYGMKLCDAELPLVNNAADFNISFFAPKAGAYTVSVANAPQDGAIYLTQEGQIIWNLTASDYEIELMQGTTSNYGLRIIAQEQVTTTIESIENESEHVSKHIINGELYIQRGNVMYDATGRRVN